MAQTREIQNQDWTQTNCKQCENSVKLCIHDHRSCVSVMLYTEKKKKKMLKTEETKKKKKTPL